jgi:uncharacterized tellurite resistance protein B-like protein
LAAKWLIVTRSKLNGSVPVVEPCPTAAGQDRRTLAAPRRLWPLATAAPAGCKSGRQHLFTGGRRPSDAVEAGGEMLEAIRTFFSDISGNGKQAGKFDDGDYRLAAAALLVHALHIDGELSAVERGKLRAVLKYRFNLDDDATDELIQEATMIEGEAVDVFRFTSLLNRSLDEEGRLRIVEMMWEMAYADGRVSEFEDNLLWRVADLLGVSSRDRILLRQQVASTTRTDPRALKRS